MQLLDHVEQFLFEKLLQFEVKASMEMLVIFILPWHPQMK